MQTEKVNQKPKTMTKMKKQDKDYTIYTVEGKGAAWKREIVVHKNGQVWVPGTRGNMNAAMFGGWPILTIEGKPRIRVDDLIASGDFKGDALLDLITIRKKYTSMPPGVAE